MDRLGDFRLRKRLAVGGMGEVYLGEKIGPEGFVKPVVLKCVLPQLAKDRAFVQLFLDEARLAALLNHPNIAQVYDFGLIDDIYYIAMEYVPGYTVDDIRRKLKSIDQFMPLQHIACIASQVCQGLNYAHKLTDANGVGLGLVHRDVSPHNLIVSIDGSVKIVDFGIAKARAGLTRVQAKGAVGKFGYMSPEQARGEVVDGRSDIFSLGICLWEMATNQRLHDPNLDRAPDYSPTRPVKSIEMFRSEVPRQFGEIVETSLGILPADRFKSCQDMHIALERFQAAMTHYAGQSALAAYIKDLVEGRVENPEPKPGGGGSVVRPAGKTAAPRPSSESMDGAQKYEEVFGVTMERKRPRPSLRAVPKSWETKEPSKSPRPPMPPTAPPSAPPPRQPGPPAASGPMGRSGADAIELSGDLGTLDLDTEAPQQRSRPQPTPSPKPTAVRHPPKSKMPMVLAVVVLVLGGLGAFAYLEKDMLMGLLKPKDKKEKVLNSFYRFETTPPGATILLDGSPAPGKTPLETELIPDVEYKVTAQLDGYATKEAVIKADVSTEVRIHRFTLQKAGTLAISSKPSGAQVTVDGRVIEDRVTPMVLKDVPAGREVEVRCVVTGLPQDVKKVTVKPGKRKSVRCDLSDD